MSEPIDLIFMGTPQFAVPSLEALTKAPFRIRLVVTPPDRRAGRGRKLTQPPVKLAALQHGIEVAQPPDICEPQFVRRLAALNPRFLVVVAFGRILPPVLLNLTAGCAVNLHASLLPRYRGPAPIQWAIIRGEKVSGVTAMCMASGLDTGDTLATARVEIAETDTAGSLHDRLAAAGAELLPSTLLDLDAGRIQPVPQHHARATYAPMLNKADGRIPWEQPAADLFNFVRGMTPWPGAYTFHAEHRLAILESRPRKRQVDAPPGTVIPGFADEIEVATGSGTLTLIRLQGPSGKRLSAGDFLRGYPLPPGSRLE